MCLRIQVYNICGVRRPTVIYDSSFICFGCMLSPLKQGLKLVVSSCHMSLYAIVDRRKWNLQYAYKGKIVSLGYGFLRHRVYEMNVLIFYYTDMKVLKLCGVYS